MDTAEDELALKTLMARYVDAVNRRDGEAWATTWAVDASWNLLGMEVEGRSNILSLWQQVLQGFEFAIMMPSSATFEVRGNEATGHWYLHEYTRDNEGKASTILSHYLDNYRKIDGQWFYQSRHYSLIYHGDPDLSGTYTPL